MNELYQHLTANGVVLSIRKGVLRMSLGLYNNAADVERTLALTREWANRNVGSYAS
jgi:cysteine sulfinate desulfinase/cysteine desulfurase-like protein